MTEYKLTESEKKYITENNLTEAEYWYQRATIAESEVIRLNRICSSMERELDRLNKEDYDDD